MTEIRAGIGLEEARLEAVARYITFSALIKTALRCTLLIEGLLSLHVKLIDNVRAIDAALPEQAEFDEFEPSLHPPTKPALG